MPIYEYKCKDCGQISELLVMNKDEVISCGSCNSLNLEKLMSAHNTVGSGSNFSAAIPGGCCGSPNSCGNPGSCCSG
jgi:putative FmdB family regulatory protein